MFSRAAQVTLLLAAATSLAAADDRKSANELIRSRGFDVDIYDVISQGFPLKVYRIINPLADRADLHPVPVVAAHGISFDMSNMMSAAFNARPRRPRLNERVTLYAQENGTDDRGLYFYLSNNNYDVWLLESRAVNLGAIYRINDKSTRNDKSLWDFSIDEQALFDLPAQLDFVLAKTRAPKAAYIAYSQSTTLMFALLSMKPEYNDKLVTFVAMAPVVYSAHIRGFMNLIEQVRTILLPISSIQTTPEFIRKGFNTFFTYFCSITIIKHTICRFVWKSIAGWDKNSNLGGGLSENVLKSTSAKTYEQYLQNSRISDFRMYDYKDEMRNMEEYGQPVPPQYNISKISLRTICLFRGTADFLSTPEDQMLLLNRLRVPIYEDHILEDYGHLDFIASPTVTRDINEPTLRLLDKLTNRTVVRVSHTLGTPNPQVLGTPLFMDAKTDELLAASTKSAISSSLPTATEKAALDGVKEKPDAASLREQMFGTDAPRT